MAKQKGQKEYFTHNYGARLEPKLLNVRMQFGMAGVGLYWCLTEKLFEEGGEISLDDLPAIAYELHLTDDEEGMLAALIEQYGLFVVNAGIVSSPAVTEQFRIRAEKSEAARQSANARYRKECDDTPPPDDDPAVYAGDFDEENTDLNPLSDTNAMRSQYERSTVAMRSHANKVKESKGKENNPPISPQEVEGCENSRDKFFSTYPKLKTRKHLHDEHVDYAALIEQFARSSQLRGMYSMQNVLDKYDAIVAGEFNDEKSVTADYRTESEIAADMRGERERYYAALHQAAEDKSERERARAEQDEEYRNAEADIRRGELALVKAELHASAEVPKIEAMLVQARRRRAAALSRLGISEEMLVPQWYCPKCSDTGWLPNGQACDCYGRRLPP